MDADHKENLIWPSDRSLKSPLTRCTFAIFRICGVKIYLFSESYDQLVWVASPSSSHDQDLFRMTEQLENLAAFICFESWPGWKVVNLDVIDWKVALAPTLVGFQLKTCHWSDLDWSVLLYTRKRDYQGAKCIQMDGGICQGFRNTQRNQFSFIFQALTACSFDVILQFTPNLLQGVLNMCFCH